MDKIQEACFKIKQAKQICEIYDKQYERIRQELLQLVGTRFSDHGVTVNTIPGKNYVDWELACRALNISDDMVQPFTKQRAEVVRITFDRTIETDI